MASTYSKSKDPSGGTLPNTSDQGRNIALVTPSDTLNLDPYAKALRVYVASGPAVVRVTPIDALDDATTVDLTFPTGITIENLMVRRVWAAGLSGSPIIHSYTK